MAIIVIGFQYTTTLGVVRSIGMTGKTVRLLMLTKDGEQMLKTSRYVESYQYHKGFVVDPESMFSALEELRGSDERAIVIPVHDKSCMVLDQIADKLADHYIVPNIKNTPGEVCQSMDKYVQKQLAHKNGIPVAEGSEYTTDSEGFLRACREVKYPCMVKPSASALAKSSKEAIVRCEDENALKDAFENARNHSSDRVVVERFLFVEQELSAYGVAYQGQAYIPAFISMSSGGFGPHRGITAEGNVHPSEELGGLKNKLEAFVSESGLNGLFCLDLLKSDGTVYFSEMNLRPGASEYAVTMAGANLPAMLLKAYEGDIDFCGEIHPISFVNEKVVLDSWRGGHISLREMLRALNSNAVHFVKSDSDPGPWRAFRKLLIRKAAGILIKGPQD